ncbi:uncharacterized protein MAM_01523 [Metarhizium album ARSEF 1941]|uniref:Zn(2)-C6 fungal-type domain-containing protein n=1 Tax=Metarhizium album (strain ARSEF 1941) TaxID=1081103 RepID=A0A0B2X5Q0_METAS|nr:uncharacterized protein MAM_01523 [Metarhizium album ARSEF 1941]KHO00745.1 hypothetical protein MAM_01523 [Metarhizium album ARSEF 1941]
MATQWRDSEGESAGPGLYANTFDMAVDFEGYALALGQTRQCLLAAERERKRNKEAWGARRARRVSGDFVLGWIWALIDRVDGFYGIEEEACWLERLERANREIEEVWEENRSVVEAAVPRYLDGVPVRMMMRPPVARGPLRSAARWRERAKSCLPCVAKGLRCSPAWDHGGRCSRCVRHEDACLVDEEEETMAMSRASAASRNVTSVAKPCFAPPWPGHREMESVMGRILGDGGLDM